MPAMLRILVISLVVANLLLLGFQGSKPVTKAKPAVSDKVSISTLVQAKKLADQMGGIEKAKDALAALTKLQ